MDSQSRTVLVSPANAKVKHLVRMRNNRARRKAGSVIVDGWRETAQALQANYNLKGIYFVRDGEIPQTVDHPSPSDDWGWRERVLADPHVDQHQCFVSPAILEKIGYGESQRGVVAEFERPGDAIDRIDLEPNSICFVLDRLEKPGNIGAIFRSAEAAGVDAILLCSGGDPLHPNAIRASSGGVFHLPWAIADEASIVNFLLEKDVDVRAARVESSEPFHDLRFEKSIAIIFGNEADGLRDRWQTIGDQAIRGIRIPMAGQVDSLNVSVAAALIGFHAAQVRAAQVRADGPR